MKTKDDDARGVGLGRPCFERCGGWPPRPVQPPGATATRPATTTPAQTSVPNNSAPATTTQTTGEASHDATVKKMNEDEKQKVETKGK